MCYAVSRRRPTQLVWHSGLSAPGSSFVLGPEYYFLCLCVCAQWLDMDLIEQSFRLNSDSKLTAEGLAATLSVGARV